MKQILQAFDNPSSMPVEESAGMKRFMSIVTEGATPHKVALPVQMAMNHYSKPAETIKKSSLFKQYFAEAEEAVANQQVEKRQLIHQYAKVVAERVQMKEHASSGHASVFAGGADPVSDEPMDGVNKPDVVKLDIPLLIRLLEYAREDAETDMDIHNVTERLIEFSETGNVLTMNNYDAIVGEQKLLNPTDEDHNE